MQQAEDKDSNKHTEQLGEDNQKQETNSKEQIVKQFEDGVCLVGKQRSQTQTDFYCSFFDGTREYVNIYIHNKAGEKENGQKQGLWKEYIFQTKENLQKFIFAYYEKGIRLPLIGNVNQQGQKQGLHVEVYGICDQLTFKGNYENDRRVGKWSIFFEGEICGGGDYDEQGLKIGQWTEVVQHYDNDHQVIQQGVYKNGLRVGMWTFSTRKSSNCPFSRIGGGNYDEKGIQVGQWTDLHLDYSNDFQVIQSGQYRNGIRVGIWEILFRIDHLDSFLRIGGGEYDDDGVKQGQWIDLHISFQKTCQITQYGEYKDGLHIGNWIYSQQSYFYFDGVQIIGGGNYDENGMKQGQWIDIHDKYSKDCQVTYQGEYKNDTRIGNWKTMLRESSQQQQSLVVGGGNYNDQGKKEGLWIDIHVNFQSNCQVTYTGQYKNGIRIKEWIFYQKDPFSGGLIDIGGGNYDDTGLKQGQWIDLIGNYQESVQAISTGQYVDGIKIGNWTSSSRYSFRDGFYHIGGGEYNEKGVKQGQWIELHENFRNNNQLIYSGQYINGIRNGKWSIHFRGLQSLEFEVLIEGGNYNEKQLKDGPWVQFYEQNLSQQLLNCQIKYSGNYQNGLPCGKWMIQERQNSYSEFNCVRGGNYNEEGLKSGHWTKLYGNIWKTDIIFEGEYNDGIQIGNWKIQRLYRDEKEYLGGGNFNQKGQKSGEWKDLYDGNQYHYYLNYTGNYNEGIRTGKWLIQEKDWNGNFNIIGGGEFDQNGIQQDQWIELSDDQSYQVSEVIYTVYSGMYKNGVKIGNWAVWPKQKDAEKRELLGGGKYNEKGVKQGQWTEFLPETNWRFCDSSKREFISTGYYDNGLRVGQWTVTYKQYSEVPQIIRGGFFDVKQVKQGLWFDFDETSNSDLSVSQSGEYKDGIRIGEWKIFYSKHSDKPKLYVGGGFYDEKGMKNGRWTEEKNNDLIMKFTGEYKNGIKIGIWDISYRFLYDEAMIHLGGGYYNQDGKKEGLWTDPHDLFDSYFRVVLSGEYKNGIRIGKWKSYDSYYDYTGGGNYDDKQMQQGFWIEIIAPRIQLRGEEEYAQARQGEYKNGVIIGYWESFYLNR